MTPEQNARIKELNEERLEIIEEKNQLTEELMRVKARIAKVGSHPTPGDHVRRAELVKEIDELNADIADINTELKTLSGGGKAGWDLRNVLTLVAAYIAAGDTRPADEMTRHAIAELEIITRTVQNH